jgi:hypothetical protein
MLGDGGIQKALAYEAKVIHDSEIVYKVQMKSETVRGGFRQFLASHPHSTVAEWAE